MALDPKETPLRKLSVLAAALLVAFVLAPPRLAAAGFGGDPLDRRALTEAFERYWRSGARRPPAGLQRFVDFWFRFHVIKGTIALLLLIALVALGVRVWKAFVRDGKASFALAGVLLTVLALFALVAAMANIQGAVAPFAKVPPLLTLDPGTLDQIRHGLAGAAPAPPALAAVTSAYARFHAAMAVIAATTALLFLALGAGCWKRFAASGSRARRVLASFGVVSVLLALALVIVAVANAGNALNPKPGLLALFNGSW